MKKLIFFLSIFFIAYEINAQITYQKEYGDNIWEYAAYMQQTSDSGYIITGAKPPYFGGQLNVYLLKIDANGNMLWNKNYGGTNSDAGQQVQETSDGGFVIAGNTTSYGVGLDDAFLIKTDSVGNIQWSKVMGTAQYDAVLSVKQTTDGGFIFGGFFETGSTRTYLVKTNAIGDTLWTKTIGSPNPVYGQSLQLTSDGGFIITGSSSGPGIYLLKTDSLGNQLWSKTYGGSASDWGRDVQNTSDGGYIITGGTYYGAGNSDVYLIKTDSIGDTLWTKAFGSPDYESGLSVQQTNDGGYIVSGYTATVIADYDIYIIKTDANGDTLWTKTIILPGSSSGGCKILEAADGGYVIASDAESFVPTNSYDILLIKTDSLGNSGCNMGNTPTTVTSPPTQVTSPPMYISSGGIITIPAIFTNSDSLIATTLCINTAMPELADKEEFFNIYPNPSNGSFWIISNKIMNLKIVINNIFGETVYSEEAIKLAMNISKQVSLHLTGGVYFMRLFDAEKSYCKKLIVE